MKKIEEIEIKLYEALGAKKLNKIDKKLDNFIDKILLALTPKSKKEAKEQQLKETKRLKSSKKIEGVLDYQKNVKSNIKSALFSTILYILAAAIFISFNASLLVIGVYVGGAALFLSIAATYRYNYLRAKKVTNKWYSQYENQKEDIIASIMTKSKELDHPHCEIISQNSKLEQVSFRKLTKDAELSTLKKYDNYLDLYSSAMQNNEPLPTLTYGKKKDKTLRLVPSYAKPRR